MTAPDKEREAIQRLQLAAKMAQHYYHKPLLICNSGGKDSRVCLALAKAAGIDYEVQHSHTTADAPETVRYVRKQMHDLECSGIKATIIYPTYKGKRTSMWELIPQKLMPPSRLMRYCCSVLKETGGKNRAIVTGVRSDESQNRSERKFAETFTKSKKDSTKLDYSDAAQAFEADAARNFLEHDDAFLSHCRVQGKTSFQPIIDWSDTDIWNYIQSERLDYNPLYDEGFCRVGCVGCPIGGRKHMLAEFRRWPAYENMYKHAFARMLQARIAAGKLTQWETADEVFNWFVEDKNVDGQLILNGVIGA